MNVLDIVQEALFGASKSIWKLMIIVFPLMIAIEIAKELNLLEKASKFLRPIGKIIGTSENSIIPITSGLLFGILYGAGLILDSVNEGNMTEKEVAIVMFFLGGCHAVFEDTLIFVQIGASGFVILATRIVLTIIATVLISRTKNLNKEVSVTN